MKNKIVQSFILMMLTVTLAAGSQDKHTQPDTDISLLSKLLAENAYSAYKTTQEDIPVETVAVDTDTVAEPLPDEWTVEKEYCLTQPDNVPWWQSDVHTKIKQWMDYRKVTSRSTTQYKVLNSEYAYTDESTGLRMYKDRICIAIGQGYGLSAGNYVDVVMQNGSVIKCIVGDMKRIVDTDPTMRWHILDGHVLEFVVDTDVFTSIDQIPDEFDGVVTKFVKIESEETW